MITKTIEADRHAHSQIAGFLVSEGYSYSYDQSYFHVQVEDNEKALDDFQSFVVAFAATEVELPKNDS